MDSNIKWRAKEEKEDLLTRIAAHNSMSKYEINDWILSLVDIQDGYKIFDVGCGSGKQVVAYGHKCGKTGLVVGADISRDLLNEARSNALKKNINAIFGVTDLNDPLVWMDETFDIVSSCFSIYYLDNVESGILELKRILKKNGTILIVGPTENNTRELTELHSRVNNLSLPIMAIKRGERIRDEVIPIIKKHFTDVKIDVFSNELTFPDVDSFIDFYKSTILFKESSESPVQREKYVKQIEKEIERIYNAGGHYILSKQVYGVTGVKVEDSK